MDINEGDGSLLLLLLVLGGGGFFVFFLFKDVLLPLWRITQQLLLAAREPEKIREFASLYLESGEVGAAQAALNELFFRVDHNIKKLQIANADALKRLAAIEASMDGICMVNGKGQITYANQAFRGLHSVFLNVQQKGPTDTVSWLGCYEGSCRNVLEQSCLQMLRQDGFWQGEIEPEAGRFFELSLTMLDDGAFIVIERDITARKKSESEKNELHAMFLQAQKMEAVGRLTGGVAHDFNNMLSVILGNLELIEDEIPDNNNDVKKFIQAAQRASQRGAELTQRLLSFSRRQVLSPKIVQPVSFLHDSMTLASRVVNEQTVLDVRVPETLPSVLMDAGQMENALLNLVINARDAMPHGGHITVSASEVFVDERVAARREVPSGAYVCFSVTDTGTGIPEDIREKIFEPFFTTKEAGRGTGLGLSMVYGFVRQSGGFVDVESRMGGGTSMRLLLPVHKASSVSEVQPRLAASASEGQQKEKGTVVIAEDDHDVLEITRHRLERMGYSIHIARNGEQAIDVIRALPNVDMLLTDLVMPGAIDGIALAKEARTIFPDIRILMLSGYAQEHNPASEFFDFRVRYLSKPYTQQRLAQEIEALV